MATLTSYVIDLLHRAHVEDEQLTADERNTIRHAVAKAKAAPEGKGRPSTELTEAQLAILERVAKARMAVRTNENFGIRKGADYERDASVLAEVLGEARAADIPWRHLADACQLSPSSLHAWCKRRGVA